MKLKYIMASFLIGSCTFISSCKDDFADINTNPTIVSKPDPRYLFTQALANFDGHDYFAWYYDYNNMLRWSQTVASTGGNENLMTTMSNSGKMGSQVYNVMNLANSTTSQEQSNKERLMRCIIYSPYWLRTILLFVVKSAFYIRTQAWGFQRCSFRQLGRFQSIYRVERVTGLAPRFHVYIKTIY